MPPYLCSKKIHKKDEFLLSYSIDGYSVGFDFPVNDSLKEDQKIMFKKLHSLVVSYGGLVYPAKDSMISSGDFIKMYGDRIKSFLEIKHKYDPNDLFQSNMYRRLMLNNWMDDLITLDDAYNLEFDEWSKYYLDHLDKGLFNAFQILTFSSFIMVVNK